MGRWLWRTLGRRVRWAVRWCEYVRWRVRLWASRPALGRWRLRPGGRSASHAGLSAPSHAPRVCWSARPTDSSSGVSVLHRSRPARLLYRQSAEHWAVAESPRSKVRGPDYGTTDYPKKIPLATALRPFA